MHLPALLCNNSVFHCNHPGLTSLCANYKSGWKCFGCVLPFLPRECIWKHWPCWQHLHTRLCCFFFFSFSQLPAAFSQSEAKEEFSELRRDHGGLACSDVDLGLSPDNQDIHMDTTSLFVSSASVLLQKSAAPDCMHTSFQDAEEDKLKGFHLFPNIPACKVCFVSVLPHRWSSLVCVLDSPRQQCANRGHLGVRLSPSAIHCCLPLDSFTPPPFCSF